MSEKEFEEFCRKHGACNVDIEGEINAAFALDLLSDYFLENPCVLPTLRDVYNQISKIEEMAI